MAVKCVHKGCGKLFEDENETCVYHPGPPEFHEGQKGWKCCKPRVLTFDEFLTIPPCTSGKHTAVDDTPAPPPPSKADENIRATPKPAANGDDAVATSKQSTRAPVAAAASQTPTAAAAPESDSDEPSAKPEVGTTCKRRGCNAQATSSTVNGSRDGEKCEYHPGQALFHEGSKGWTCCKRRVLEFDEFMKIPGCKTRPRHCFVGKKRKAEGSDGALERVDTVRSDFYQTGEKVHASMYLKKIDKEKSSVVFEDSGQSVKLSLQTTDGKLYATQMPLFGRIDPAQSAFRILGTKLDLTLVKADGIGWPVLRSDERLTGEIIQTGRAGRA